MWFSGKSPKALVAKDKTRSSQSSRSSSGVWRERGPRGRGKSVSLPMSLKFDGKSNWKAFYAKFSRYAEVSEWTEEECRDQLCWCLDGKASEYYALLVERNHDMAYKDLILKIEKRVHK
jgi:hypothetical protein